MKKFLTGATAATALATALATQAIAAPLDEFARLSWSDKVRVVIAAGGKYRRDSTGVLSGMGTSCLHITEAIAPNGSLLEVRATMDNSVHQWCFGSYTTGKMTCVTQENGLATTFVLIDGVWHSVN